MIYTVSIRLLHSLVSNKTEFQNHNWDKEEDKNKKLDIKQKIIALSKGRQIKIRSLCACLSVAICDSY